MYMICAFFINFMLMDHSTSSCELVFYFALYYLRFWQFCLCCYIFLIHILHECLHSHFLDFLSDIEALTYVFGLVAYYLIHFQTSMEMSKIQSELNEKTSEIRRLQVELARLEDEDANDSVKSFKRVIATLEKENNNLKVNNLVHFKTFFMQETCCTYLYKVHTTSDMLGS